MIVRFIGATSPFLNLAVSIRRDLPITAVFLDEAIRVEVQSADEVAVEHTSLPFDQHKRVGCGHPARRLRSVCQTHPRRPEGHLGCFGG